MERRRLIKSALVGCSIFLAGCSSDPDSDRETNYSDETETPDYPEVGELYIQKFESDEDGKEGGWDLVLELNDNYTEGTLGVTEIDERRNYDSQLIDRINLQREESVLRFPYIREATSPDYEVLLPRSGYLFTIEVDSEVVAESRFNINRDISVSEIQFESYIGGDDADNLDAQILEFGKTSFSVRIGNTGNVPLVIQSVKTDMPLGSTYGFWLNGEIHYEAGGYRSDILPSGETKRYGAVGYTLPKLEEVEEVCDGSERTTILEVGTHLRRGLDTWRYEIKYHLDEPATGTGIGAPNRDPFGNQERFVCESGEILEFNKIDSD